MGLEERNLLKYVKTVSRSLHTNGWKETEEIGGSGIIPLLIHFIPIDIKHRPGVGSCEVGMGVERQITSFLLYNVMGST